MLFQLPRSCRVFVALSPANQWGWDEILANKTNYLLDILVWMKTKDAQRRMPRSKPKPFVPDFMKQQTEPSKINKGAELHTADEIQDILSMPRG